MNQNHESGIQPSSYPTTSYNEEPRTCTPAARPFVSRSIDDLKEAEESKLEVGADSGNGADSTTSCSSNEEPRSIRTDQPTSERPRTANAPVPYSPSGDERNPDQHQDDRAESSILEVVGEAVQDDSVEQSSRVVLVAAGTTPTAKAKSKEKGTFPPSTFQSGTMSAKDHQEQSSPDSPQGRTARIKELQLPLEAQAEDDDGGILPQKRASDSRVIDLRASLAEETVDADSSAALETVNVEKNRPSTRNDGTIRGIVNREDAKVLLVLGDEAQRRSPSSDDGSISSGDSVTTEGFETSAVQHDGDIGLVEPTSHDILCGRGRGYFQHPGNRRMLEIVKQNKARYKAAAKLEKTEIVWGVTRQIEAQGSRFLKYLEVKSPKKTGWVEASADEKHKKVCHCLREEKHNSTLNNASESPSEIMASQNINLSDIEKKSGSSEKIRPVILPSPRSHSRTGEPSSDTREPLSVPRKAKRRRKPGGHAINYESNTNDSDELLGKATTENDLDGRGMAASSVPNLNLRNYFERRHDSSSLADPTGGRSAILKSNPIPSLQRHPPWTLGQNYLAAEPGSGLSQVTAFDSSIIEKYGIVVGEPTRLDVLFGQDPTYYSHFGNINLRRMVQESIRFPPMGFDSKLLLARHFVAQMKFSGSRFLTRQRTSPPGIWYRVEDIEAESLIFRLLDEEEARLVSSLSQKRDQPVQAVIAPPESWLQGALAANSLRVQSDLPTSIQPEAVTGSASSRVPTELDRNGAHPTNKQIAAKQGSSGATLDLGSRANLATSSAVVALKRDEPEIEDSSSSSRSDDDEGEDEEGLEKVPNSGLLPGPHDVICGRGRGNFRHAGNRRMLRMFWEVKDKYNKGTKAHKTMIGRTIVEDIRSKGGRFLKQSEKGWEEVDRKTILRKVCHGIRDIPSDPEKRKRSIVADELEEPLDRPVVPNAPPSTAPWLASQAPKRTKTKTPILRRQQLDTEEGGLGKNPEGESRPTKKRAKESNAVGGTDWTDVPARNDAPAEKLAKKGMAVGGTWNTDLQTKKDASPIVKASLVADPTTTKGDSSANGGVIRVPADHDVLLGRGKGFFQHYGNRRMQQIISECTTRYKGSSKLGKSRVVREVIAEIQSNGARFLKRVDENSGGWGVVSPAEALQKVSHGIRDYMASLKITPEERSRKRKLKSQGTSSRSPSPPPPAKKVSARSEAPKTDETTMVAEQDEDTYLRSSRAAREPQQQGISNYDSLGLVGQGALLGAATLSHASGGLGSGVPLEVLLAARQRVETEAAYAAAAAAAGGGLGHRLSPEEHLLLFQAGNPVLTPAEQMMILRQMELQRRYM